MIPTTKKKTATAKLIGPVRIEEIQMKGIKGGNTTKIGKTIQYKIQS